MDIYDRNYVVKMKIGGIQDRSGNVTKQAVFTSGVINKGLPDSSSWVPLSPFTGTVTSAPVITSAKWDVTKGVSSDIKMNISLASTKEVREAVSCNPTYLGGLPTINGEVVGSCVITRLAQPVHRLDNFIVVYIFSGLPSGQIASPNMGKDELVANLPEYFYVDSECMRWSKTKEDIQPVDWNILTGGFYGGMWTIKVERGQLGTYPNTHSLNTGLDNRDVPTYSEEKGWEMVGNNTWLTSNAPSTLQRQRLEVSLVDKSTGHEEDVFKGFVESIRWDEESVSVVGTSGLSLLDRAKIIAPNPLPPCPSNLMTYLDARGNNSLLPIQNSPSTFPYLYHYKKDRVDFLINSPVSFIARSPSDVLNHYLMTNISPTISGYNWSMGFRNGSYGRIASLGYLPYSRGLNSRTSVYISSDGREESSIDVLTPVPYAKRLAESQLLDMNEDRTARISHYPMTVNYSVGIFSPNGQLSRQKSYYYTMASVPPERSPVEGLSEINNDLQVNTPFLDQEDKNTYSLFIRDNKDAQLTGTYPDVSPIYELPNLPSEAMRMRHNIPLGSVIPQWTCYGQALFSKYGTSTPRRSFAYPAFNFQGQVAGQDYYVQYSKNDADYVRIPNEPTLSRIQNDSGKCWTPQSFASESSFLLPSVVTIELDTGIVKRRLLEDSIYPNRDLDANRLSLGMISELDVIEHNSFLTGHVEGFIPLFDHDTLTESLSNINNSIARYVLYNDEFLYYRRFLAGLTHKTSSEHCMSLGVFRDKNVIESLLIPYYQALACPLVVNRKGQYRFISLSELNQSEDALTDEVLVSDQIIASSDQSTTSIHIDIGINSRKSLLGVGVTNFEDDNGDVIALPAIPEIAIDKSINIYSAALSTTSTISKGGVVPLNINMEKSTQVTSIPYRVAEGARTYLTTGETWMTNLDPDRLISDIWIAASNNIVDLSPTIVATVHIDWKVDIGDEFVVDTSLCPNPDGTYGGVRYNAILEERGYNYENGTSEIVFRLKNWRNNSQNKFQPLF